MAKKREEFADIYKWDTTSLYKNDEEALKKLSSVEKSIKKYKKFEGHILDNADSLLELLLLDRVVSMQMERLFIYAHIKNDADTTDTKYQELFGKVKNVYAKYLEKTAFIVPELLEKDYKVIQNYLKEKKELKEFARSLKKIYRVKKHVLSKEVESVLANFANMMSSFDEIMGSLTDSDFTFDDILVNGKKEKLTESNYSIYIRDKNQNVRKQAFESLYKTYGNFKNTLATTLKNEVEKNVVNAKIHNYKNSLNSALFHDEIDEKVYYNLIDSIHQNLPSLYRYWALKKKVLNLKEMHLYDTYAEIENKKTKKYTFEEARDLVLTVVKPLGDKYVKDLTKAFNEKWIDSCNNIGKRGGAYCTACYSVHPYVLLSFEGMLNDVSTLAHELGHAMHYYYAQNNQSFEDYSYSIFVAEVASQVNEILLSRYLLDHSDSNYEKLQIIDDLLQKYKSSIFRQTMFAEFELFIHEYTENGGVLTHQNMSDKYLNLNKLYFGPDVIIDDEIKYEWERIPHFYMNFYVYQYATGFASAIYLANQIYDGNTLIRDKYLEFLKLGCTKNPIDSLKIAGVDITNTSVYKEAINFMDKLIQKYSDLIGSEL